MKIINQALQGKAEEMNISEDLVACYERIGMQVYSKYGKSCYDYNVSGSPVDVQYIEHAVMGAQDAGMDHDHHGNIVSIRDTDTWAAILVEFWDKYPNY